MLADAVEHVASGVGLALALAEVAAVLDVVLGRAVQVSYTTHPDKRETEGGALEGEAWTTQTDRLMEPCRRFYISLSLSVCVGRHVPEPEM